MDIVAIVCWEVYREHWYCVMCVVVTFRKNYFFLLGYCWQGTNITNKNITTSIIFNVSLNIIERKKKIFLSLLLPMLLFLLLLPVLVLDSFLSQKLVLLILRLFLHFLLPSNQDPLHPAYHLTLLHGVSRSINNSIFH